MRELSAAKLLTEGVHPKEEQSMTKAEKRCEWLTDKYILCLLALFPLFTGFHGYANLTAAKFWLYTGVTALWALGIAACLCTGARLFAKKPGAFFYLTCAFLIWNLVSAALSPWREKTFLGAGRYDGLFTQFLYALTALGIARWGRKKIIYARVFGASIFLCCAVALWQIAGGNPLGLYPNGWRFADAGTLYSGMYLGTVGNTLILGSVLSLAVPVLVYTAVKKRGYDLLLLLPAAMALYILYRSECSSAWVALPGSCALMLPKLARGRRRRYILAAEGALALTVLLAVYFYPGQSGTLYEASRLLWREVCALIAQRPVRRRAGHGGGAAAHRVHALRAGDGTDARNVCYERAQRVSRLCDESRVAGACALSRHGGRHVFPPAGERGERRVALGRRGVLDAGIFRARPCRERAASVARVGAGAGAGGKERRT